MIEFLRSAVHLSSALSPFLTACAAVFAASWFGVAAASERRLRVASSVERLATTSKLLADLIRLADGRAESLVVDGKLVTTNIGLAPQVSAILSIVLLVEVDPALADAAEGGLSVLLKTPDLVKHVTPAIARIQAIRRRCGAYGN